MGRKNRRLRAEGEPSGRLRPCGYCHAVWRWVKGREVLTHTNECLKPLTGDRKEYN